MIGWNSTSGTNKLNEFRLAFYRDEVYQQGSGEPGLAPKLGITGTADGNGVPVMDFSGQFTQFGIGLSALGNTDDVYELHDAFSWLVGRHQLKFGADVMYYRALEASANAGARGHFTFTGGFTSQIVKGANNSVGTVANTGSAFADFLLGVPTSANTDQMPFTHYRWTTQQTYGEDTWKIRRDLTMNAGLGYFLTTPPNPVGPDKNYPHSFDFNTGQVTYAALGQISPEVYDATYSSVVPRVGLAWQPGFAKDTVVRAGFGIYYAMQNLFDAQFSIVGPGVTQTQTIANSQPNPTYLFGKNALPPLPPTPITITPQYAATASGTIFYIPQHYPNPYVEQWTLDVQHTFGRAYLLDVAYLGNGAHHTRNQWDGNDCAVPGTLECDTSVTPYPISKFPFIYVTSNNANSNYNALLVKFDRQFANGLNILGNYTYSKAIAAGNQGGAWGGTQTTACFACERAVARYNIPQALVVSAVWDLPVGKGRKFLADMNPVLNTVIGNWGTDLIASFEQGVPVELSSPNFTAFSFRYVRPNWLCNGRSELQNKDLRSNGLTWFKPGCYARPAPNYFGTARPGAFPGPGVNNWDISARKVFPIRENLSLQFKTDFFNAFNHTQFGTVQPSVISPSFGLVTGTQLNPREIQFAAMVQF